MDCATIANGIIKACRDITVNMPIVVRLEGKVDTQAHLHVVGWAPTKVTVSVLCACIVLCSKIPCIGLTQVLKMSAEQPEIQIF